MTSEDSDTRSLTGDLDSTRETLTAAVRDVLRRVDPDAPTHEVSVVDGLGGEIWAGRAAPELFTRLASELQTAGSLTVRDPAAGPVMVVSRGRVWVNRRARSQGIAGAFTAWWARTSGTPEAAFITVAEY